VRKATFDPFIAPTALALVMLVLLAALIDLDATRSALLGLQDAIVENFAWLFSLTVTGVLVFVIWLACSRLGTLKLGADDSEPEFSRLSWLAMLFSAGMGIGLIFFGVAEPVLHFLAPPSGLPTGTPDAAREAMRLSVFHWGLHAWGIYALFGLGLALFHFRYGQPLAIRSLLEPWLGARVHRWPGKLVDTLAVLGTLFGLATSLGLGAIQINAGLLRLFDIAIDVQVQMLLIIMITVCATVSLVLGLDKGIRRLSEWNILLAAALLLFLLVLGPTATLLRGIPDALGGYLQNLPGMSLRTHPFRDLAWQKSWTIFYWAWWLSWAPFVGTFIARISRGRRVREFVVGVLLVPTGMTLVWFAVFGGAALQLELAQAGTVADAVQENTALAVYTLLDQYPLSWLTSLLCMMLVAVFFITSSDSGSFVIDMLASGGDPDPSVGQRIFWASAEGVLAILLLNIGGLNALQAGTVSLGLPVCLLAIALVACLLRKLGDERT
jgi:choline/glycine/proline betaine transport protein